MKNAQKNVIQQFCVRVWGLKSVARNCESTINAQKEPRIKKDKLRLKDNQKNSTLMLHKNSVIGDNL